MWFKLFVYLILSLASGCQSDFADMSSQTVGANNPRTIALAQQWRPGQVFVWGYYPGGGQKPRMYEAYVQLRDRAGYPMLALMTLFTDEEPRGIWNLHDGIAFNYESTVAILSDMTDDSPPPVQMYGWDHAAGRWFPSTNHPNTLAHVEKFNYRRGFSNDSSASWTSNLGCYDGIKVKVVPSLDTPCLSGELVIQNRQRSAPKYVFWPYYSVSTGVTLFKQFNDDESDPDSFVSMRLVFSSFGHNHQYYGDDKNFNLAYKAALLKKAAEIVSQAP